jgi:hypothetical protein
LVVGLYGGDITVPTPYLPLRAMTLRGSYVGSQTDMAELLDLVKRTGIPPVPIRTRPLDEVNATLNDARSSAGSCSRRPPEEKQVDAHGRSSQRLLAGRLRGSRNRLSEAVICALLRDFSMHGEKAIAAGNVHRSRHALNADTIREMHAAFRQGGREAIDKVMQNQPAVFLKLLVLLVPRQMALDHSGGVKALSDEQLERAIELLREAIAKRDAAANAKVIDDVPEQVPALPRPSRKARRKVRRSDRADSGLAAGVVGTDSAGGNS